MMTDIRRHLSVVLHMGPTRRLPGSPWAPVQMHQVLVAAHHLQLPVISTALLTVQAALEGLTTAIAADLTVIATKAGVVPTATDRGTVVMCGTFVAPRLEMAAICATDHGTRVKAVSRLQARCALVRAPHRASTARVPVHCRHLALVDPAKASVVRPVTVLVRVLLMCVRETRLRL